MDNLTIYGNVGGAPEMRYMPDGTAVTNLSVACQRYRGKDDDGNARNETVWYRVAVWGGQAEAVNNYVAKGDKVLVVGELTYDEETGGPRLFQRNDGTTGASFEMRARRVEFGNKRDSVAATNGSTPAAATPAATYEEDDIPF